jgi:hypothetical protein
MLGMLSGKNYIKFRNSNNETLSSVKYNHHGGFHHDDNDDGNHYSGIRLEDNDDNGINLMNIPGNDKYFHTLKMDNYEQYAKISGFSLIPAKKVGDDVLYNSYDNYSCRT